MIKNKIEQKKPLPEKKWSNEDQLWLEFMTAGSSEAQKKKKVEIMD